MSCLSYSPTFIGASNRSVVSFGWYLSRWFR